MVQSHPPDVNVLPVGYRPRRITAKNAATIGLVAVLVIGLMPAYAAMVKQRELTSDVEDRLSIAEGALAAIQGQQAGLLQTEQRIYDVKSEIEQLTEEFGAIGQDRIPRADSVAAAVTYLVPRVYIESIIQMDDIVVLTGEAGSQELALYYSSELLESGEFANVRILSMVNADPLGLAPDVTFSISLEG